MNQKVYDLIVLGGGAGGLTVAAGAASLGARVALVERATLLGGDCLHTGCVPSKALIATAKQVHAMKQAAQTYGCVVQGCPDFGVAMQRVREAISMIQKHDDVVRFQQMGIDVFQGMGRLASETSVEVTGETGARQCVLQGKRIVVATGSHPFIPNIPGLHETAFLTNETIFSLQKRPDTMVVLGGGVIGLELAQALARWGTRVTVLDKGAHFLPREEPEIVERLLQQLRSDIELVSQVHVQQVTMDRHGRKRVTALVAGQERVWECEQLLVAAGRVPNTASLRLAEHGVHMQGAHIVVDETLRTTRPRIFAVGDVIPTPSFTHAAGAEGKAVVANALFGLRKKVNYDRMPWTIFTDPEVFHLGMTEMEARMRWGDDIRVMHTELAEVDRFAAEHDTQGIVKVITTRKGIILGAHAIGTNAGDWMQTLVYAQTKRQRIGSLSLPIVPYPSRTGAVQRIADAYWREKLFTGIVPQLTRQWLRWWRTR